MKKKVITITVIILILLGLITGFVLWFLNYKSYTRIFQDTDNPVSYKFKDGEMIIVVTDKKNTDLEWKAEVKDPDFVDIEEKGKGNGKSAKYVIKPKIAGLTEVYFTKSVKVDDIRYDKVNVTFMIYVSEELTGLQVNTLDNISLDYTYNIIGEKTEYPVVLSEKVRADGDDGETYGNIDFINGKSDWTVTAGDERIDIRDISQDGRDYIYLLYQDDAEIDPNRIGYEASGNDAYFIPILEDEPEEEPINTETDATVSTGEGEITISSQSLGITKTLKVTFYKDGHVVFAEPAGN